MRFRILTKGFNDIIDITPQLRRELEKSNVTDGALLVFVAHSTCSITTIEYEPGVLNDLKKALEAIAPIGRDYEHDQKAGDGNGYAHVRAGLMKPALAIPIEEGKMVLGRWQQVVLIDFDNRPREREIIVKII